MTPPVSWPVERAQHAFDAAKKKWGTGWWYLSKEMKEASVAREVVMIQLAQVSGVDSPLIKLAREAMLLCEEKS